MADAKQDEGSLELHSAILFGFVRGAKSGKVFGFVFVGESASGMAKAKVMMHKNAWMNLVDGKAGDFTAEGVFELREKFKDLSE